MSRLIDADALLEKCEFYETEMEVAQAPTIDPVKHGRWIEQEKGIHLTKYRCSECGRVVWDDVGYDVCRDYPYCHCGARMEGEEDE